MNLYRVVYRRAAQCRRCRSNAVADGEALCTGCLREADASLNEKRAILFPRADRSGDLLSAWT